jgi:hypothetical protein
MAMAVTGKFVPWQGRVLTKADLRNSEQPEQNPHILRSYQRCNAKSSNNGPCCANS